MAEAIRTFPNHSSSKGDSLSAENEKCDFGFRRLPLPSVGYRGFPVWEQWRRLRKVKRWESGGYGKLWKV